MKVWGNTMRNPWPMFGVLALTGLLCIILPLHTLWIFLIVLVVLVIAWLMIPIKYDDWLAKQINPCVIEYQQKHDLKKLENGIKRWRPWAITKTSRNMMQVNWFCALLEQEKWEAAENVLEEIKACAKTTVDWMNYHLLQVQYAEKTGNQVLADQERQLVMQLKAKVESKKSNGQEKATAKQCKQAFFCWISFALFLLVGGGVCTYLLQGSIYQDLSVGAVIVSFFALPVAVVWLVVWLMRKGKEKTK